MKYIVETSLFGKLIDGHVRADELPSDGPFLATHVQRDELSRTSNPERRAELLAKFTEVIDGVVPTASAIFGPSVFGEATFSEEAGACSSIMAALDLLNGGKQNNAEDALIADTALKNGYTLLTADYHLHKVARSHGIDSRHCKSPQRPAGKHY